MRRAPDLAALQTKPPRCAAVAAGNTAMRALPATKRLFLIPSPWRGEAGTVSTAIAIKLLFGSVRLRPRLPGLPRALEWEFRALPQPVAQLVRHQPRRVVAQRQFARQEQRRHAALVLRHHPR